MFENLLILIISFFIVYIITPKILPWLVGLKFGQTVREEGPKSHQTKTGTPTMGGVVIIIALSIGFIFFIEKNLMSFIFMVVVLGYGAVGFLDDYIKVVKKHNLGLRAYQKLIGQFVFSLILVLYQYNFGYMGDSIYIPIINQYFKLGIFYIPVTLFIVLGIVNSVNLTDGLDGLASGTTIIFMACYSIALYILKEKLQIDFSFIPFSFLIIGACIGFLFFNKYPAKIFMGDVGSLALGGSVASISVLSGTYLLFPVIGFIYFIETISVVIQVVWYKLTRKRVFLMSPIHHHFEEKGWKETKVVLRFWAVASASGLIGILIVTL
jgi:phospho-N-acetylmuramoyl-pentapeptide-transferase